jgi:hypothetical protein
MKHIEKIEITPKWILAAKYRSVVQIILDGHEWDTKYPLLEKIIDGIYRTDIQNLIQRVEGEMKEIPPFREDRKTISRDELLMRTAINSALDTIIKMLKEEPAYIGGVNLTTNDNEVSSRLAVTDKNIDQLRQWLNEDKIDDFKKMITNDDIKFWLDIK